jgi:hypothetical protein
MKLVITVKRMAETVSRFETPLSGTLSLNQMHGVWQAERRLNDLPGSELRFHFNLEPTVGDGEEALV